MAASSARPTIASASASARRSSSVFRWARRLPSASSARAARGGGVLRFERLDCLGVERHEPVVRRVQGRLRRDRRLLGGVGGGVLGVGRRVQRVVQVLRAHPRVRVVEGHDDVARLTLDRAVDGLVAPAGAQGGEDAFAVGVRLDDRQPDVAVAQLEVRIEDARRRQPQRNAKLVARGHANGVGLRAQRARRRRRREVDLVSEQRRSRADGGVSTAAAPSPPPPEGTAAPAPASAPLAAWPRPRSERQNGRRSSRAAGRRAATAAATRGGWRRIARRPFPR